MGSVSNRNGRWRVVIRRKNAELYATFSNKETAILWMKYKEDIIDEIEQFDFKLEHSINLNDAIDLKLEDFQKTSKDKKSIYDIKALKENFSMFLKTPVSKIKSQDLITIAEEMLSSTVSRGGNKSINSGKKTIQSPVTVFKKFACLSTVYSLLIKNGAEISNPVNIVLTQLRSILDEKKDKN